MPSIVNELILEEYRKMLGEAPSLIVVHSDKLSGNETNELRMKLGARSVKWRVVRSRLAKMALEEAGRGAVGEFLNGQSGFFISEDPIQSAQAAVEAEKELKGKITVGGGWVEDTLVDEAGVRSLASMPPRPVLEAMLVGAVKGPLTGLVRVLSGLMRNVVVVLGKIADKGGEDAPEAASEGAAEPGKAEETASPEDGPGEGEAEKKEESAGN